MAKTLGQNGNINAKGRVRVDPVEWAQRRKRAMVRKIQYSIAYY